MSTCIRILLLLAFTLTASAQNCDRECLRGFITRYLDAMVAHNPGSLPTAANVRFTEDEMEKKLGEGIWKTATRLRGYRQDFLDVREGVAATHVIVEEASGPVMLALRLKVAGQKITEVETLVTRGRADGALFNIDALQSPRKEMAVVPPKAQLAFRAEAIRIAQFYPAGLKVGSFVEVDAPFTPGAYRVENGSTMAGPGCTREGCQDIKKQSIIKHPDLTSRVLAVDEEMGLVLLWMNFGDTGSYGAGNALKVFEAFKVYGGQIHAVEAFMKILPAKQGSGWD
jgi:hypothetical protein